MARWLQGCGNIESACRRHNAMICTHGINPISELRFLVALPRTRDLLLFAKHLFAAAIRWQTEEIWSPLSFTEGDHDVFPDDPAPVAFRRHPYRPDNSARDGGAVHRTPLCRGQSAAHQQ